MRDDILCYGFMLGFFCCFGLGFFVFVLFLCDLLSVLRFQLKAVIFLCSQDEFKVSHPAPTLLLVSDTLCPEYFSVNGQRELQASWSVRPLWSTCFFSGCNRQCRAVLQWNVFSTSLSVNQHLNYNSVAGLKWSLFLNMGNQWKCFNDDKQGTEIETVCV